MDISAFSGQNKVTTYLLTRYTIPNTDKSNNIQTYQVYTMYMNTNMDSRPIRIVCPIYTVNFGGTRSDLVA